MRTRYSLLAPEQIKERSNGPIFTTLNYPETLRICFSVQGQPQRESLNRADASRTRTVEKISTEIDQVIAFNLLMIFPINLMARSAV